MSRRSERAYDSGNVLRAAEASLAQTSCAQPPRSAPRVPDANQPGLYNPNAYRSSDHDPVMVGLRLGEWTSVYVPLVLGE
jgi:hypothetical protein